jgi:hypothetical protein
MWLRSTGRVAPLSRPALRHDFKIERGETRARPAQERTCPSEEEKELQKFRFYWGRAGGFNWTAGWYRPRWAELRVRQALQQVSDTLRRKHPKGAGESVPVVTTITAAFRRGRAREVGR